jgi:hypothetical protein
MLLADDTFCCSRLTETSNQTSDNELSEIVGSTLQQSANDHDERAEEDSLASTKPVSNPDCRDRTRETSQIVSSNDNT